MSNPTSVIVEIAEGDGYKESIIQVVMRSIIDGDYEIREVPNGLEFIQPHPIRLKTISLGPDIYNYANKYLGPKSMKEPLG